MAIVAQAVSGPYEWFYGPVGAPVSLGVVEDAVTIRWVTSEEVVVGDNLGDTIQAIINRGHNCFVDIVFQEANLAAVQEAMWPYVSGFGPGLIPGAFGSGVTAPTTVDSVGQVRNQVVANYTQLKGQAVSNATDGTPAAFPAGSSTIPGHIRANNATLAPNQNLAMIFGSRHRPIPLSFLCMPFVDPGAGSGATYSICAIDDLDP